MTTLTWRPSLSFGQFVFDDAGLTINQNVFEAERWKQPSFEEWQACGVYLRGVERSIQMWVGAWVNYGRERWGEQAEQGIATELEQVASEATGWKPETVEQYARVERQTREARDPDLTYSHHREVSDLPPAEQRVWLARAKAENWSTDRLRGELKAVTKPDDTTVWLLVRCASAQDREALSDKLRGEGREVKLP